MSKIEMIDNINVKLDDFDLIVVPCNYVMDSMSIKEDIVLKEIGKVDIINSIKEKYGLPYDNKMNESDIRIITVDNIDLMYVKFPFMYDDESIEEYMVVLKNMFNVISFNDYKKVLLFEIGISNRYGFGMKELFEVAKLTTKIINEDKNDIEYSFIE